jgi:predicted nucleic acid-binding protein
VSLFVDTSVWSLALRRDGAQDHPAVRFLTDALAHGKDVVTTGLVLQELLQGFRGPKARQAIVERFQPIPLLAPSRDDHIEAAALRNRCRQQGVQAATVDALIAELCLRHELPLLTTDKDFEHIARIVPLQLAVPV